MSFCEGKKLDQRSEYKEEEEEEEEEKEKKEAEDM